MSFSPTSETSLSSSVFGSSGSDIRPQIRRLPTSHQDTHQPRLTSPRLFRDFFSGDHTNDSSRILPPARFQETSQDVTGAIADASRAIQNAQHALQLPPIVDLTESSPRQSPESLSIAQTTHPHDSRQTHRRPVVSYSLHDPVYGHDIHSRTALSRSGAVVMQREPNLPAFIPSTIHNALLQDPNASNFRLPTVHDYHPPRPPTQEDIRREEARAIQRQRNSHALWQRNQRRQTQNQSPDQKAKNDSSSLGATPSTSPEIESVDLTQVDDKSSLADALSKQRRDAISSQQSTDEKPTGRSTLTSYKCPICMETPTDATTTVCGHLFCHRCIIDTLKWSEEQRALEMNVAGKVQGVCPVCRKPLGRKDTSGNKRMLIPLEIKLVTRKRKREDDGGKGKERARDESEVVDLEKLERREKKERARSAEMWNDLTELEFA